MANICQAIQILYNYFGFPEVKYVHLLYIIIDAQKVLCGVI